MFVFWPGFRRVRRATLDIGLRLQGTAIGFGRPHFGVGHHALANVGGELVNRRRLAVHGLVAGQPHIARGVHQRGEGMFLARVHEQPADVRRGFLQFGLGTLAHEGAFAVGKHFHGDLAVAFQARVDGIGLGELGGHDRELARKEVGGTHGHAAGGGVVLRGLDFPESLAGFVIARVARATGARAKGGQQREQNKGAKFLHGGGVCRASAPCANPARPGPAIRTGRRIKSGPPLRWRRFVSLE